MIMQNTAVYAPITFEEIVMVMIIICIKTKIKEIEIQQKKRQ